jgi:hypothetical protein
MVGPDLDVVDRRLRSGGYACVGCGARLRPWGWAGERQVRGRAGVVRMRPRRSRCRGCAATHVLLPVRCLLRRLDAVEVIGAALLAKARGAGHRRIAARLGRPATTVRGWLRRFGRHAQAIRGLFLRLAVQLDPSVEPPSPAGSALADAVTAIGVATAAATRRLGPGPPWQRVAAATGGQLLATQPINTSWPWAAPS